MVWLKVRSVEAKRGTWTLGFSTVALTAAVLFMLLAAKEAQAAPTTFTVNSTADPGEGVCQQPTSIFPRRNCTLREAINAANSNANATETDFIKFSIPGNGTHTISPTSELPSITQPVTIDGYTQGDATTSTTADDAIENTLNKGTNAVLKIELNGANMVEGNGFTITGGGTTIRGLVINRFKEEDLSLVDGCGIFLPNLAPNTNNVIEGNFIGTDVTGTQDLGNESPGVFSIGQSINNRIGGTTLASRNLISGNGRDGVAIDSSQNTVQGNLIGTDKGGTQNLGNGSSGVEVAGSGNLVTNNTIAFNALDGVTVFFDSSLANRILKNSIFSNVDLGIDLDDDGATPNDPQDPDTGPNGLQNKPALLSATTSSGTTTIEGRLNSTPNETFTIQFFSQPSGNEGKVFRGKKSVTDNDGDGIISFTFKPANAVPAGQTITATATGTEGTSEFSAPKSVVAQ